MGVVDGAIYWAQWAVNRASGMYVDGLVSSAVSTLWLFWVPATAAVAAAFFDLPLVPRLLKDAVRTSAARGKSWDTKKAATSWFASAAVPHSWFWHFYVIGMAANTVAMTVLGAAMLFAEGPIVPHSLVVLAALQTHLFRRWAESAIMMRYPPGAKMHVLAYLFSLAYYTILPFSLIPVARLSKVKTLREPLALVQHVYANMWPLNYSAVRRAPLQALQLAAAQIHKPQVMLGLAIIGVGQILQFAAHKHLAGMARTAAQDKKAAAPRYTMPSGGLFDLVACPHYMAEIVMYFGFWVTCGYERLPGVILCWVTLNLLMGGKSMQTWYQEKFEDYPKDRKAVIPYLY